MQESSGKYIIIGCGPRSASFYIRTVLRELGLEVGHEDPEKDGVVGWQHLMPNHPWTLAALRKGRGREKVYIHQFRHPVSTINSMAAMYFRKDWPPLSAQTPVEHMFRFEPRDTPVMKAMRLYYHMNVLGLKDQKFKLRYRVEDIDSAWPDIATAIGMKGVGLPDIPRDTNTHKDMGKYPELEWIDICSSFPQYAQLISKIATKMGYDVADKEYL